jgi:PilZ domain-containing protein
MASVAAGSRLLIRLEQDSGDGPPLVARGLRRADLDDDWVIPVLVDADGLPPGDGSPRRGVAEVLTDAGPRRLEAELMHDDHVLVLRTPGLRAAAFTEQRRENVRGEVQLPLRGTVLAGGRSEPGTEALADLNGVTASVSAGGICAALETGVTMPAGARIYVELSMPGGDLAPCVLSVVASEDGQLRARFIDISPLDRERLVRLVFARQRAELAARRRLSSGTDTP